MHCAETAALFYFVAGPTMLVFFTLVLSFGLPVEFKSLAHCFTDKA